MYKLGLSLILFFSVLHCDLFSQCNPVIRVNPASQQGCEVFTVQFFDESLCTIQQRNWDFGDGTVSSVQNPIHSFNAGVLGDTVYTVELSVQDIGGVWSSETVQITVFKKPSADFSLSRDTLCAINDVVNLTNLSSVGPEFSFTWNYGDLSPTDNSRNSSHTYNNPGDYDITLTVTDDNGCSQNAVYPIVVNEIPNPNFSTDGIVGCHPMDVEFTNTTVPGVFPITSWNWNLGGLASDGNEEVGSFTFDDPGVFNVTLSATNSAGCSNSTSNNIFVNETPTSDFDMQPEVCKLDTATIIYPGTGTLAGVYTWESTVGSTNFLNSGRGPIQVVWDSAAVHTVTLTVEENGCSSTSTEEILVNDLPVLELTTNIPTDSICEEQEIIFTASPSEFDSYTFYNNDSITLQTGASNEYITSTLGFDNEVSVWAEDSNACIAEANTSLSVTVLPLPLLGISSDKDTICEGEEVTFTATGNHDSYTWFNGFLELQDSTIDELVLSDGLEDGDQIYAIATKSGCVGPQSNFDTVTVKEPILTPELNCGASTNSEILFVWNEVDRANDYEIFLDGGPGIISPSTGEFGIGGLNPGDTVWAQIRALGDLPCGASILSDSMFCIAQPCDTMNFTPSPRPEICFGDSASLSISDLVTASAQWSITWANESPSKDTLYRFRPDSSGFLTMRMVDSSQLVCPAFTFDFQYKVNQLPQFDLLYTGDTLCEFSEVRFESTQAGFDNYQFSINDSLFQDSTFHVLIREDLAFGDNRLVLNVTENGCSSEDSVNVFIVEKLNIALTASEDSVCIGESFRFSTASVFDYYRFYDSDNNILLDSTISDFVTTTESVINLVATDRFGCETYPTSDTVVLKPLPVTSISSSSLSDSLCIGESVTLTATPGVYDSYEFYRNYALVQQGASFDYTTAQVDSGSFYFTRAINDGCIGPNSDTLIFKVFPEVPTPQINCGVTGNGAMEFTWDPVLNAESYRIVINDGLQLPPSSGVFGLSHIQTNLTSLDTVCAKVIAFSDLPCGNSELSNEVCCIMPCGAVNFDLLADDFNFCEGEPVEVLIRNIVSVSSNLEFSWNGGPRTSTRQLNFTATADTTIEVTVWDLAQVSCTPTTKSIDIKVHEYPSVTLTGDTLLCSTDQVILEATPTIYDDYQFLDGFLPIASGLNPTQIDTVVEDGHSYSVIATNNGCSDTSNVITISVSQALEVPDLYCGESTDNTIAILWDSVPNAVGYEISLNGFPWITPNSGNMGLSNITMGFQPGDTLIAKVRAIADEPCDYSEASEILTCLAVECDLVDFDKTFDFESCQGDSVRLEVNNILTPSSQFALSWNGVDYAKDSVLTIPVFTDTVVNVSLIDSTQLGCPVLRKDIEIRIQETPEMNILDNFVNDSLCEGELLTLTADTIGYDAYQFYINDVLVQDSLFYAYETDELGPGPHEVKVVSADNGCFFQADSTTFEVVSFPEIQLTSSDLNDTICDGDEIIFNANVGFDNYEFYQNGISTQSSAANSLNVNNLVNQEAVYSIGSNQNLCFRTSDTITTEVIPIPVVGLTSSDDDNVFCDGDTIELTISPQDLDQYVIYLNGDSILADTGFVFQIDTLTNGDELYVEGIEAGCSSFSNTISNTVEFTPTATTVSDTNEICVGTSVILSASGGTNYLWSTGSQDSVITVTPTETTAYAVSAIVGNCESLNDTLIVLVDTDIPVADAGFDEVVCRGESIQLFASGGMEYLWLTDSVDNDSIFNPTVSPFDTTDYTVVVKNLYCRDTSTVRILVDRCLTELPAEIPQIITPNGDANNEFFYIQDIDYFEGSKLTIFNRWSNRVYEVSPYLNQWNGVNNRGNDLAAGTYYYVLELGEGLQTYTGFIVITR